MAAMIYECLLLVGVLFGTALLFGVLTQTRHALDNRHALQVFLFVVLGAYFSWFWSKGQTLAMKTWHLHLQQTDGRPLARRLAVVRYLLSWGLVLPPVVFTWFFSLPPWSLAFGTFIWLGVWYGFALLRQDKQCLHDVVCGTRMVYIAPPRKPATPDSKTNQP